MTSYLTIIVDNTFTSNQYLHPAVVGRFTAQSLARIAIERNNQETLKEKGKFRNSCADEGVHDNWRFTVLGEEFGEVSRELNESSEFGIGRENNDAKLASELIQVAAVCVAWLEAIAMRNGGKLP